MGYIRKNFIVSKDIKAFKFLIDEFGCSMSEAQKWIDKRRVYHNGKILLEKNLNIKGDVGVIFFEPLKKGLKPIYESEDFVVFDKPSGVLVHPNSLSSEYSLNDEIKFLYGKEANVVHRIDRETSGLVLVSKNKENEAELKKLFEDRVVQKAYIALVFGKIDRNFTINAKLKSSLETSKIRIKSHVLSSGQEAITVIEPLKYLKKPDITVVKAMPMTGRTHQIRVHLFHVKHPIVGDPIYALNEEDADRFLNSKMSKSERKKLTGADRLMLHANYLSFVYKGIEYNIKSKLDFERFINEQYIYK